MRPVYIISNHILSSLGFSTQEHMDALKAGRGGIQLIDNKSLSDTSVCISKVNETHLNEWMSEYGTSNNFTLLERMMFMSIHKTLAKTSIQLSDKRSLLIISSTKGNIDLLNPDYQHSFPKNRMYLGEVGKILAKTLGCANQPLIVSNACISGVLGIIIGKRLIEQHKYDHVLICGADLASKFVISGFQSLKAMSSQPCRPYDQDRDGISLGEGCASMLLSSEKINLDSGDTIRVIGGAITNDANHISGPSRTGEGLFQAVMQCLEDTQISPEQIDFISAHGTATPYNDEMESIAFQRAGLLSVPVNSFKGYIGHTLGAAGVIESVLSMLSMQAHLLFSSLGYNTHGVSNPMNIIQKTTPKAINICLKTASGFGGCNAAVLFAKEL